MRFKRLFSSSSCLKRRSSDTPSPPVLLLPAVICLLRDPKLPTDLGHTCACLFHTQGKGNLFLSELRLFHRQNLLLEILPENTNIFSGPVLREEVPCLLFRFIFKPLVDFRFVGKNSRTHRFYIDSIHRQSQFFLPLNTSAHISMHVVSNLLP